MANGKLHCLCTVPSQPLFTRTTIYSILIPLFVHKRPFCGLGTFKITKIVSVGMEENTDIYLEEEARLEGSNEFRVRGLKVHEQDKDVHS